MLKRLTLLLSHPREQFPEVLPDTGSHTNILNAGISHGLSMEIHAKITKIKQPVVNNFKL